MFVIYTTDARDDDKQQHEDVIPFDTSVSHNDEHNDDWPQDASSDDDEEKVEEPLESSYHSFKTAGDVFIVPKRYEFIKSMMTYSGFTSTAAVVKDTISGKTLIIQKYRRALEDPADTLNILSELRVRRLMRHENVSDL